VVLAAALAIAGCGGEDTGGGTMPKDMTILHDMASVCGHPGDTGNSLGVGEYCNNLSTCSHNSKATLCTILGSDNAYFCTMACSGAGSTECGENASCTCSGGQCGCFPDRCK
jgi:hypothetical protein